MKVWHIYLPLTLCFTLASGMSPGDFNQRYLDPSQPLTEGFLRAAANQTTSSSAGDTLGANNITSHNYKYPGKAMLWSLVIPGAGQYYAGRSKRTLIFLGVEVVAVASWDRYRRLGNEQTGAFQDTADVQWNFRRWLINSNNPLFLASEYYTNNPRDRTEDQILIGTEGTHYLEFFIDMDEDGRPEVFGNTKENNQRLYQLLASQDSSSHLYVKKNKEYYENIGKYNQFFPGWDDAEDYLDETPRTKESGFFAYTEHRSKYLKMRNEANRLKSIASYSISAIMFNHVISAVDAIFATANWNREHATRFSGQLLYSPSTAMGVGGVRVSFAW